MRPRASSAAVAASLALLAGCQNVGSVPAEVPAASPGEVDATLVADQLRTLQRLTVATPIEQGVMVEEARLNFVAVPTAQHGLHYALLLATPGHEGFDPVAANALLAQLLAEPDALSAPERDLAQLVRHDLGELLSLQAQVEARQAVGADATQRLSAAEQRNQALASENARLRQELELATRKLEAIAELEKALATRPTGSETRP